MNCRHSTILNPLIEKVIEKVIDGIGIDLQALSFDLIEKVIEEVIEVLSFNQL